MSETDAIANWASLAGENKEENDRLRAENERLTEALVNTNRAADWNAEGWRRVEAENERLRETLRSIADRESQTAYGKRFPIESRCTVAIVYEDRARAALTPPSPEVR